MDVDKSQTLAGLDLRNNSIGFLRFFFAASVIWSHAFGLTGDYDPVGSLSHHALSAGLMAVSGFFVLSGFLITRSYEGVSGFGRFLWHRVLRIFPGFWVCLAVVAFVLAPLAFVHEHGSLSGFFAAHPGPVSYVVTNALLTIRQGGIDGLLGGLPYPFAFNGSLWTLAYEFACYLAVGALGVTLVLRRARGVVGVAALCLFLAYALLVWEYGTRGMPVMLDTLSLFVYFGFGAAAYLFRDQIPMRAWIAAVCAVVLVAALPTRVGVITAPVCLAYLTMYAAQKLPIRNFDRRMDLSYGLYIYAFPIQQLLILYGVNRLGLVPYVAAALFVALAFAAASWFAIERPCLALKNAAIPAVRVGAPWRPPTSPAS